MFWSKKKQLLKDKEAGLVFNWRNMHPLAYPLLFFVFLSLIVHFLFLQLFDFPNPVSDTGKKRTGTLFLLKEDGGNLTQSMLAKARRMTSLATRGHPDVDPQAKGIDDQLSQPMTAGIFDWAPEARDYPDTLFDKKGEEDLSWNRTLPPVDLTLLNDKTPAPRPDGAPRPVLPHFLSLSPELAGLLDAQVPSWKGENDFSGVRADFMIVITPEGKADIVLPINGDKENALTLHKTERWLKSLPWKPSRSGGRGIVSLEWKEEAAHD